EFQLGPAALEGIYVPANSQGSAATTAGLGAGASTATPANPSPSAGGGASTQQIPLSSIARVVERSAPLVVNHIGQFPAATISFNLAPGASLGDAVKDRKSTRLNSSHR